MVDAKQKNILSEFQSKTRFKYQCIIAAQDPILDYKESIQKISENKMAVNLMFINACQKPLNFDFNYQNMITKKKKKIEKITLFIDYIVEITWLKYLT